MLHITVDTADVDRGLWAAERYAEAETQKALAKVARLVQAEAIKRCPKGPTKAQAKGTGYRYDKKKSPGTLERSIRVKVWKWVADVGVLRGNAMKYARFIHDGKYNLGPGSRAKGAGVGPRFLDRAYDASEGKIERMFDRGISFAVERAGMA